MNRRAVGAVAAQGVQALTSFVLQVAVARTLGLSGLGAFAIVYGVVVLASGVVTGFVGDSLVVLDRRHPPVRAALQQFALALAILTGAVAGAGAALARLITPLEAALVLLATALFCLEEVLRRTLMARLLFWRVALIDACGLVVVVAIVGSSALLTPPTLATFLLALAGGQLVALLLGVVMLPRDERFLVPFRAADRRTVARYGIWRSLQQFLRPALLTAVRSVVGVLVGLAATGLLEAARVYTAPALLLVSGLSSYLFASYAKERSGAGGVRRADRAVGALVAMTAAMAVVAVLLLPVVGPLLFRTTPDLVAVVGWLLYTVSVAAVTPYGALAAVAGRQAVVFAVRAGDTLVSLAAVVVALLLGADPAWAPALLVIGSLAGGLVLRRVAARAGSPVDAPAQLRTTTV